MKNKIKLTRPLVFFDLETTGVNTEKDRIVQLAAFKFRKSFPQDNNVSELKLLMHPQCAIPKHVSKIHGITDADVKFEKTFAQYAKDIRKFFKGCDVAGYNIGAFDIPILWRQLEESACALPLPCYIDMFAIVKHYFPRTLSGAYTHYTGKDMVNAHDAMSDVMATISVFKQQLIQHTLPNTVSAINSTYKEKGQLDLKGQIKLDDDNNIVLTFGKHRNIPIQDVDVGYMQWATKNFLSKEAVDIMRKWFTDGN